jgi:hypothetical protein
MAAAGAELVRLPGRGIARPRTRADALRLRYSLANSLFADRRSARVGIEVASAAEGFGCAVTCAEAAAAHWPGLAMTRQITSITDGLRTARQ